MSAAERLVRLAAITPRDRRDPLAHYITTLLTADPDLAQDIEDGAALRRLRSACEAGGWTFSVEPWYAMEHVGFRVCLYSRRGGSYTESTGPTIAAAADACRVALEASRA